MLTPTESSTLDAAVARALGVQVLGEALCSSWRDGTPGWHVERRQESGVLRPVYLGRCGCADEEVVEPGKDAVIFGHCWLCLEVVPCYSTEIAAALTVLRALLDHVPPVQVAIWPHQAIGYVGGGSLSAAPDWHFPTRIVVEGPPEVAAPEAICRAALKALTGEEEQS